jgi:hypothetical protein
MRNVTAAGKYDPDASMHTAGGRMASINAAAVGDDRFARKLCVKVSCTREANVASSELNRTLKPTAFLAAPVCVSWVAV